MKYQIVCWFHPKHRDSTSAPQHPSVTLKEEEEEQRSLHQTPEPKQWELGVDSPRRSHLPRREWSPFVSYCGMWRQIDEGRVIPLGPGEAAGSAESPKRHHKGTPSPSVSTLSSHMTQQPDATNLGKWRESVLRSSCNVLEHSGQFCSQQAKKATFLYFSETAFLRFQVLEWRFLLCYAV